MLHKFNRLLFPLLLATAASGCATMSGNKAVTATPEDKAQQKIAFAIGREVGSFTITNQREGEAPGGSVRTEYAISTKEGTRYNCYIYESSGFGKVMSFGMSSGSDAVCSVLEAGGTEQKSGTVCNTLLKAAGKC
ncbi:hypothetical protein [Rheinheimera soli]|uniref:Uncharacterized protein n=1 Tax=Rheinheimera soli TaxID=443616 RepID=A0ABU1VVS7_9GAMM|nr:hypothetical protein [Rheinheimera soli]MDR7119680.1 hypothetical protein [Rheinheimera soli]